MIAGRHSEDYAPISWIGQYPVYLTTILVAIHVACMVLVALGMAATGVVNVAANPVLAPFVFSGEGVTQHFRVWQFFTYAFVNTPSLWFAVEMYLLLMFGREVEKFLGRRSFIWLYLALMLAIPTVLTGLAFIGRPEIFYGSGSVHFAVFIAFVAIYPSAQIFFGLQAKWIAVILLAINSLTSLAYGSWIYLGLLWMECACAYGMVRMGGVRPIGESFGIFAPDQDEDMQPRREKRAKRAAAKEKRAQDPFESIDPLLEKISKDGIGSLTKRERERLEKAREALIERERGGS